jgi:predicted negative regulator of RcsB-dependent stress response
MANHLDLEEQEQLDQIKHFWRQYGSWITGALVLVLAAYAAWNGWNYWTRQQAQAAAALYDLVEQAAQAGDVGKLERSLSDMQDNYGRTAYAQQAGLLAAKVLVDQGKNDAAQKALSIVVDKARDEGHVALARLRLSALQMQDKKWDTAKKTLEDKFPPAFEALAADRRGDLFAAQGQTAGALAEYEKAYRGMDESAEYRRLVEAKLVALGGSTKASAPKP